MGDVDKLQVAEEAAAQRAEAAAAKREERRSRRLGADPVRLTATKPREVRDLPLDVLHPGENIRPDLPEVDELARSIREVGLLSPLIVRPWSDDHDDGAEPADGPHYRLVAGHRRHAALVALRDAGVDGHDTVACELRTGLTEAETYALMLTENVQRIPLEPIQAARALRLLLDLNEGMDAATLARSLGVRPAWAQTHLKLLDLPADVQDRVESGDLSVTIADLLRRGEATGRIDAADVSRLAAGVATGVLTAREVREAAGPKRPATSPPRTVDADADGRPLVSEHLSWDGATRPPTPLTAASPTSGVAPTTDGTSRHDLDAPSRTAAAAVPAGDLPHVREAAERELPLDERADAYLLGRALREWASDDDLDAIGIDREQCELYAAALEFTERISAIRHLSSTLMNREPLSAGRP